MDKNGICKTCRYSHFGSIKIGGDQEKFLHCRKYAPRILCGTGEGWSSDMFPRIQELDWCGEWKQKIEGSK